MRKVRLTDATLKRIDAILTVGDNTVAGLATVYGLSRSALHSQLSDARARGVIPRPKGRRYVSLETHCKRVMWLPPH